MTSHFKWEGKPQFCSVKAYAPAHNLPPEKELIGTSSILAPGKSQVLPPAPFLLAKLTTLIDNLADRRSAINRQEGGIAASKVCLKALPLSFPFPLLPTFLPFPQTESLFTGYMLHIPNSTKRKKKDHNIQYV